MNKKEVLEIRKQLTPERCAITRICGCYVTHEKEKKALLKKAFLSLPEEEEFKYFDIFRHVLSGTVGKNLINMNFPTEQEFSGGTQEFLLRLRDSGLTDDRLLEEFYDLVINHFDYSENYYIVLIHSAYDVPGKSSDGSQMFDASDVVYEHILCALCPVNLTRPGLAYNADTDAIEEGLRHWIVDLPVKGFLFPAFHDRMSDIHSALYYSKQPEQLQPDFITHVLGSQVPLTARDQKTSFQTVVKDTLGEECVYEVVRNIHENLQELIEEAGEEDVPLTLEAPDIRRLLIRSGVPLGNMENFDRDYNEIVGEKTPLMAANIGCGKSFQLETPDVLVKVNPQRSDLVETRIIDGRKCIVIAVDSHLQVNGVDIH